MVKRGLFVLVTALIVAIVAASVWAASTDPAFIEPGNDAGSTGDEPLLGDARASGPDVEPTPWLLDPEYPAPPASVRQATVARLADGDSFDITWVDDGQRDEVRLRGVNAPELDACFGLDARAALEVVTTSQVLLVEALQRDEFGRLIANVWAGDVFLNVAMVEQGAALALRDGGEHAALIADAQLGAQGAGAGLWSADTCASSAAVVAIVTIEADAPGRDDEQPNGEWIEIVNLADSVSDLSGWTLRDESTRNRFEFPDGFVLDAGASVKVRSGCGQDGLEDLFWCAGAPVWNNGGDTGFLVDPDGRFADTLSYSS